MITCMKSYEIMTSYQATKILPNFSMPSAEESSDPHLPHWSPWSQWPIPTLEESFFGTSFWTFGGSLNSRILFLCICACIAFSSFCIFVWWISLLGEFRSLDLLLSSMVLLISLAFLSGFFQITFHSSKECAVSTCFQCRYHEGIKIHRSTTTKRQSSQPHTYIYQSFLALIECNIIPPVASSVYICHKHSNEKLKVNTY